MWYAAQALGLLTTLLCVLSPQLKEKWQQLLCCAAANAVAGLSFFFLGGTVLAAVFNVIAVAFTLLSAWYRKSGRNVPMWQNALFSAVYLAASFWGLHKPLDLLPIMAVVFFLISVVVKDPQTTRYATIPNIVLWIVYDIIVGSSAVFAQLVSLVSVVIGICRYRGISDKNL